MARRKRLVPAREIVIRCDPAETEHTIDHWQRKLRRIDRALLQGLEDLAAGDHRDRRPQPLQYLSTDSGKADLEPLQVVQRTNGLAKPARRLRPDDIAKHRVHVVLMVDRLTERLTATVIPPGGKLHRLHAERHCRDQCRCRNSSLVIADPHEAGLDLPVLHRFGNFKRRYHFARLEVLEFDSAVGNITEVFGDHEWPLPDHRHHARKRRGNTPANGLKSGPHLIGGRCNRPPAGWAQRQRTDDTDEQRRNNCNQQCPSRYLPAFPHALLRYVLVLVTAKSTPPGPAMGPVGNQSNKAGRQDGDPEIPALGARGQEGVTLGLQRDQHRQRRETDLHGTRQYRLVEPAETE